MKKTKKKEKRKRLMNPRLLEIQNYKLWAHSNITETISFSTLF